MNARLVALACLPALACGGAKDGGAYCVDNPEPKLVVGQLADSGSFVSLADAPVEVVYGPQGGWHMELVFEASGMAPDQQTTSSITATVDGQAVACGEPWVTWSCGEDMVSTVPVLVLFGDCGGGGPAPTVVASGGELANSGLHGRAMTLQTDVRDSLGRVLTSTTQTTVLDPRVGGQ